MHHIPTHSHLLNKGIYPSTQESKACQALIARWLHVLRYLLLEENLWKLLRELNKSLNICHCLKTNFVTLHKNLLSVYGCPQEIRTPIFRVRARYATIALWDISGSGGRGWTFIPFKTDYDRVKVCCLYHSTTPEYIGAFGQNWTVNKGLLNHCFTFKLRKHGEIL